MHDTIPVTAACGESQTCILDRGPAGEWCTNTAEFELWIPGRTKALGICADCADSYRTVPTARLVSFDAIAWDIMLNGERCIAEGIG